MSNIKEENFIRIEKYYPLDMSDTGPKNQYIYKCLNCSNEIKIKAKSRFKTATGLCSPCNNKRMWPSAIAARRLLPFQATFNRIMDSAKIRNIDFNLLYKDFLKLTEIAECHYCLKVIVWKKYGVSGYNLDRKNNDRPYELDNLVICCGKCNKGKREIYSYEEWYGMTKYFRDKK